MAGAMAPAKKRRARGLLPSPGQAGDGRDLFGTPNAVPRLFPDFSRAKSGH